MDDGPSAYGELATPCPSAGVTVIACSAYEPFIAGGPRVTAFLGARVALIVDAHACLAAHNTADARPAGAVVRRIERLLAAFDACVGRTPPVPGAFHGRLRVEVAFLDHAAGLAHHGVGGCAVGPAFLQRMLEHEAAGTGYLDHVLCYELCRNYIFPDTFTAVLDYRLASEGPECWGWVNQGIVNVLGCLVADPEPFYYHGSDRPAFLESMEAQLVRYICDDRLAWGDVFHHERLPWDAGSSLDNVYSGLLVALWRGHGGRAFLARWFAALPLLLASQCRPASKEDWPAAADCFYLAASCGAGDDLCDYFEGTLRWPVSGRAREACAGLVARVAAGAAAPGGDAVEPAAPAALLAAPLLPMGGGSDRGGCAFQ